MSMVSGTSVTWLELKAIDDLAASLSKDGKDGKDGEPPVTREAAFEIHRKRAATPAPKGKQRPDAVVEV